MYHGHIRLYYVDTSCYPPITTGNIEGSAGWDAFYYSPGLCPSGYTTCIVFNSWFPGYSDTLLLNPDTTAAVCCPSGYTYTTFGHLCGSSVSKGEVVDYFAASLVGAGYSLTHMHSTFPTDTIVHGDGVPIMWQSSDQTVLASATAATASNTATSTTGTLKTGTTSQSSTNDTNPSSASGGGLSKGASIGIGVGAAIGVLMLLGVLLLCIRSRKKRSQPVMQAQSQQYSIEADDKRQHMGPMPAEMAAHSQSYQHRHELPTMYSQPAPAELEGSRWQ
ncbi:hypothetical protein BT63DRAFT_458652 [Microthyrium microscopicum]|uniref:Uncharacterized protein n=1 Tax=Microthyrium microscopicum TaxID=703497 RepID=A0A6A6U5S5_9PEZI|nr:hypothetical protein BT63DRAFT_458652 [Microthyrium microscopicum]